MTNIKILDLCYCYAKSIQRKFYAELRNRIYGQCLRYASITRNNYYQSLTRPLKEETKRRETPNNLFLRKAKKSPAENAELCNFCYWIFRFLHRGISPLIKETAVYCDFLTLIVHLKNLFQSKSCCGTFSTCPSCS